MLIFLILVFVFIFFCIDISYNTLLLTVYPHDIEPDIGIAMKLIPGGLNVIELDVLAKLTIVSNDFNFVDNVLYFLNVFFDL